MQPRHLIAALLGAGVCAVVASVGSPLPDKDNTLEVQILGINDFHGIYEWRATVAGVAAGAEFRIEMQLN